MRLAGAVAIALFAWLLLAGAPTATSGSIAENLLHVSFTSNGAASTASCQLMVLADLVVGAASLESVVATPSEPVVPTAASIEDLANTSTTSTSTCQQPVGTVTLVSGAAAGWDEVGAPSGGGWAAVAPESGVSVLSNRMWIELDGAGPAAAAGCQTLVAIDALVLSASVDEAVGTSGEQALHAAQSEATEQARASCEQSIELLDIILAG